NAQEGPEALDGVVEVGVEPVEDGLEWWHGGIMASREEGIKAGRREGGQGTVLRSDRPRLFSRGSQSRAGRRAKPPGGVTERLAPAPK
ncbi:MAG: hypothetical protein ACYSTY_14345, partial [Planctomycetota bacterium]